MGGRWFSQIWLCFVLFVAAGCGDNLRNNNNGDAGPIDASDAPDGPVDAPPDGTPDAPPDAACSSGTTPMFCSPDGCTDLSVDPLNCGACGTMCDTANGAMCLSGVCCDAGEANCSGQCVDFQDDEMNCGDCGIMCAVNQTCTTGVCLNDCTVSETNCGAAPGTCTDTMVDNDNCGMCGTMCDPGESCSGGTCVCATPDTCSGVCTNTNNDPANCGVCGDPCGTSEVCNNGVCTTTCLAPTTNCSGSCANTQNDPFNCGQCGTQCGAGEVCNAGTCTTMCTAPTATDCNGACSNPQTDPANCGTCGTACPLGATCTNGGCACPAGAPTTCDGVCANLQTDEANCGVCGVSCNTGQSCTAGVCITDCGGATPNRCGIPGVCTNFLSDNNNCGGCNQQCDTGEACTNGVCLVQCTGATPNRCDTQNPPGFCTNTQTDAGNCGSCGATCLGATATAAAQVCTGGACACVAPDSTLCNNNACIDTLTDPAHCGGCNAPCPIGTPLCNAGQCVPDCQAPTPTNCSGSCVNTTDDESNCGTCGNVCPFGSTCTAGVCGACPAGPAAGCPAVGSPPGTPNSCVNPSTDPDNCGGCNIVCGVGQSCSNGTCCNSGQVSCNGTCTNTSTDPLNCGGCGPSFACGAGQACNSGSCECGYGQTECPPGSGTCITTSVDPLNCGGCGTVCPAGLPLCVSNGCTNVCPPPLSQCPRGPGLGNGCTNRNTDSQNCGNCGNTCPTGQGCSDGACVPLVLNPPPTPPAKCVGGGPPIFVPTGGGSTCTGNLGSVQFTFALCSRTDVGQLSQPVTTDAFNSAIGPYLPIPNPQPTGGSIGVNGTISDTAKMQIGGSLYVGGAQGMAMKGDITIRERLFILHALELSKLLTVEENDITLEADSFVGGTISRATGSANASVQDLVAATCAGLPASLTFTSCTANLAEVQSHFVRPPCGTDADLVPVRAIVTHFANPANNDNASIGLNPDALRNASGSRRLDLPCGYYHLTSISGSAPITIVAHGRTALFISGAIDTSQAFYVDLVPGATLDVFVGGAMVSSQEISIGNPAYPRLSRFYIGSPGCKGTGSCTAATDCCSGLCTNGSCVGAGGLSDSLKLSGGTSFLNGVFYAGEGEIRLSNTLEMYGALFANYYLTSGPTIIHYDEGVVQNGEECPPLSGSCDTCRDCDNQACNGGTCGACAGDADCCAPLRCVNPGPQGRCEL